MDLAAAIASLNYWAVVSAAAAASFVIGGLWYSPMLFQQAWMQTAGVPDRQLRRSDSGLIFIVSFALQLIASFVLAIYLPPQTDLVFGLTIGLLVGTAWVATALGVVYLFERRRLRVFWINAGYQIIAYGTMGAILGGWR